MNYRFTRAQRLLTPADYSRTFDHPFRSSDRYFTVLAKAQAEKGQGRLGLAIAKKQLKKAHDRNLVKRIVRESFRLQQEKLTGFDIVVLVKGNVSLDNRQLLHQSLKQHWGRIEKL
ncbi:ribonuclease P protein component [Wohlfahrtiimonas chitiniclastica]|uniref:ribonuclease P protein component n=1 Tax=Wohlfahrtiimonas chitiniclastica TaxID=400946 RepID=UPI0003809DD4|nr:ribonuclease P protein component [Wohlfahrtiimonas chitiniclastica]